MQLYDIDESIDFDDEETMEYDLTEAESAESADSDDDQAEQESTWEWDGEKWKRVD